MPRSKYRRGKRRRMDKFSLAEVSFVDRPAQTPAIADIQKRRGPRNGEDFDAFFRRIRMDDPLLPREVARDIYDDATFTLELEEPEDMDKSIAIDDERFSDEEWDALKSLRMPAPWDGETREEYIARNLDDATKRATANSQTIAAAAHIRYEEDLAEKRKGPKPGENFGAFYNRVKEDDEEMTREKAREIFDGARGADDDANKRGDLVDIVTSSDEGHQHGVSIMEYPDGYGFMVRFAASEDGEMHDHSIVFNSDGTYSVTENRGHTHTIDSAALQQILLNQIAKSATELDSTPSRAARERLARIGKAMDDGSFPIRNTTDLSLAVKAFDQVSEDDQALVAQHIEKRATDLDAMDQMPEQGNLADLFGTVETSGGSVAKGETQMPNDNKELDALKAENEALKAVTALSAVHKSHYDSLDDAGKEAFLKADDAAKDADIAKAEAAKQEEDPVVYKSAGGQEFRKSDDPRLVEMAKAMDEQTKENERLAKAAEDAALEKRAETDLANMTGDLDTRKALLKAVDGIEDDKVREAAHDALKAHSASQAGDFQVVGTRLAPAGGDDAASRMDELAKSYSKEHSVSYSVAYERVGQENPALYAKAMA